MPLLKRKVFAYITRRDQHGDRLLVFSHPNAPEAGIQVPAGTLLDGERPEDGVLREAHEETGLTGLELVSFLGERLYDLSHVGRDEIHHRSFFHLRCPGTPPSTWRHQETDPDDDADEWPLFEFFWVGLPDGVPDLIADYDALLPALLEQLVADEASSVCPDPTAS
jgi:8-oxo-dGTP diphosphatase